MNFNLGLTGVRVVPFNGTVSKAKETEETGDNKFKPTPTPLPPVYEKQQEYVARQTQLEQQLKDEQARKVELEEYNLYVFS